MKEKWANVENEEKSKITNPCKLSGKHTKRVDMWVPLHNYQPEPLDVILVNGDGSTELIGRCLACAASGMYFESTEKLKDWQCYRTPHMIWKKKDFPKIAREDCIMPSYWNKFGWHFTRLANSRVVDFNSVDCVPVGAEDTWTQETQRVMYFRRKDKNIAETINTLLQSYEPGVY